MLDLARDLAGEDAQGPEVAHAAPPIRDDEPIAIVGLARRFPRAPDPNAFCALLRDGVDAIREVPKDRRDTDALFDTDVAAAGKTVTRELSLADVSPRMRGHKYRGAA
jgi:hypothetical protein